MNSNQKDITISKSKGFSIAPYLALTKTKLTTFVVISSILGYLIGVTSFNALEIFFLVVGGYLITASSNSFNQIIEREYDTLMDRTKDRPLPSNILSVRKASIFAIVTGVLGTLLLFGISFLCGILGTLAIFSYVAMYTPLKRVSPVAILVGGVAGAIPPMLGLVAAQGHFGLAAGLLFAIQFAWQMPHFLTIGWRHREQYQGAGFKLLPYPSAHLKNSGLIFISIILLVVSGFIPYFYGMYGNISLIILSVMSAIILLPAFKLLFTKDDNTVLRILILGYFYLMVILGVLLLGRFGI